MSGSFSGPSSTNRGGTLFFKVDGTAYDLAGSFSIKWGGIVRDPVIGPDGPHGFKTKYTAVMIECELQDGDAVLLATIQGISDNTLTAELDNGKSYVLINAFQTGELTLDPVETKIKASFSGMAVQELTD